MLKNIFFYYKLQKMILFRKYQPKNIHLNTIIFNNYY